MAIRIPVCRTLFGVGNGGFDLHFFLWQKYLFGSVKPSPAALIRAALRWVRISPSPQKQNKKPSPLGLGFCFGKLG